jgi:hypothetical protein
MASVPTGSVLAPVKVASISPNPFTGSTTIVLEAPATASIDAGIFDVAGRHVASLVAGGADGKINGGTRTLEWKGTDASGLAVPPGIYFLRLEHAAENGDTSHFSQKLVRIR